MADIYRVEVDNADRTAALLVEEGYRMQERRILVFREMAARLEDVAKEEAPEGPEGEIPRFGIKDRTTAAVSFRAAQSVITVRTSAKDPISGFDYLRVSRFGHRKTVIRPVRARKLKVHVEGHRNPHVFIFKSEVAGFHPDEDWVVRAARRMGPIVRAAERRLASPSRIRQGML